MKEIWYLIGFFGDRVAHVTHELTDYDNARSIAEDWFDNGVTIEGHLIHFDKVVCISENHETCFHTEKAKNIY